MKISQILIVATVTALFSTYAAGQVTFTFSNSSTSIGASLDGSAGNSFTVDGIEITANASINTFNVTSTGFGINQDASNDDTDGFDFAQTEGPGVAEGFTLSFDKNVQLVSFDVSSWNAGVDAVLLMDGATQVAEISSSGITSLGNYTLSNTSTLTVTTTAGSYGNGWSFDAITVVPEPHTFSLLAGCFAMVSVMFRRR